MGIIQFNCQQQIAEPVVFKTEGTEHLILLGPTLALSEKGLGSGAYCLVLMQAQFGEHKPGTIHLITGDPQHAHSVLGINETGLNRADRFDSLDAQVVVIEFTSDQLQVASGPVCGSTQEAFILVIRLLGLQIEAAVAQAQKLVEFIPYRSGIIPAGLIGKHSVQRPVAKLKT
jgi:hypothetical protein